MADASALEFHRQKMAQEKQRVALRIAYGTKASSPQIRNVRRQQPLYYSNPLPDNSTGSKIRPFGINKDESDKPTAMEQASGKHWSMVGGVVKDYRYARSVLDRRARDTQNIQLESEGLPTNPEPVVELSQKDSMSIELNNLLQNVESAIETANVGTLTISDLKNIPRLLITLVPTMSESEITSLIQYIEDDIVGELSPDEGAEKRVREFMVVVLNFLKNAIRLVGQSPQRVSAGIKALAKDFFGKRTSEAPTGIVASPLPGTKAGEEVKETLRQKVAPGRSTRPVVPMGRRVQPVPQPLPPVVEAEVADEEDEGEEAPRETGLQRHRRIAEENVDDVEELATIYQRRIVDFEALKEKARELGVSDRKLAKAASPKKVLGYALERIGLPKNWITKTTTGE